MEVKSKLQWTFGKVQGHFSTQKSSGILNGGIGRLMGCKDTLIENTGRAPLLLLYVVLYYSTYSTTVLYYPYGPPGMILVLNFFWNA